MEVIEEERQDGRPLLNYTHMIKPGVTQLENYGQVQQQSPISPSIFPRTHHIRI